jgi:hypothetical protein
VTAAGGADVPAFQSTFQIGAGIQIMTPITGEFFNPQSTNTLAWTGGDPDALITVYFVDHLGWADVSIGQQGNVSDGSMSITWQEGQGPGLELDIEVTPGPSEVQALGASGLSLGGQHLWKYTHRFFLNGS